MTILAAALRRLVRKGELTIIDHKGGRQTFGVADPDYPSITLKFHDAGVERAILKGPALGLGEMYMEERLTFEQGSIDQLINLASSNIRWEDGHGDGTMLEEGWSRTWRWASNNLKKSRANVAHHYDVGNALYKLFLDEDMQYSMSYFTGPDVSLEQSQKDKKAHIAAKLHLKPGQKVLDIGCGWGGMALYLNKVAGVEVLGITLSEEQLALARERAAAAGVSDQVKFELIDYRQLNGQFDRIVSVGMFEHVGADNYRAFFAKCRDLLTRDGVMLLHTIGRYDKPSTKDPFFDKYIFPGYHLPNLSQLVRGIEKEHLMISDVEILRMHYGWTLEHWLKRLRDHRQEVEALYDGRFMRMWEYYLSGAKAMFEFGDGCNFQVQYVRDRHAIPATRDYMYEDERRYRAIEAGELPGLSEAAE